MLRLDPGVGCTYTAGLGTVTSGGTTPPAVTFTGTPASTVGQIQLNITTPGALGTAMFEWFMNGVLQQTGQTTTATFVLGTTGVTANFPVGSYVATNYWYVSNNPISAIADQSGTGDVNKNVLQATASAQPTLVLADSTANGQPTILFGCAIASLQALVSGTWASALAQPSTWIVVAKGANFYVDGIASGNRQALYSTSSTNLTAYAGSGLSGTAANTANWHVYAATFNGASSNIYQDNSQTALASGACGAASLTGVTIGNAFNVSDSLQGSLGTIEACSGVLSAANLQSEFERLGAKYGITVS